MVLRTKKTILQDRLGKIEQTTTKDWDKKYPLGFKEISRKQKRMRY